MSFLCYVYTLVLLLVCTFASYNRCCRIVIMTVLSLAKQKYLQQFR
jgi:hypothetical protein